MRAAVLLLLASGLWAQAPRKLTLPEAEATAIKNHPQVSAALLTALAANQVTTQVRSAYYPNLFGSMTGAGAVDNSRIAAGGLNNPVIFDRFATGVTAGQLITDFGRTSSLVESSKLRAQAQEQTVQATRADVLLQVDRAYFTALRAQAVLQVAEQTVKARQLVADQVTELAKSKLKSGLDVSFAGVNLSDAKLLLVAAQNEVQASFAELSAALGYAQPQTFELAEAEKPPPLTASAADSIQQALRDRPELAGARSEEQAAQKFAEAEKGLWRPTVAALASAGAIPGHDDRLSGRYAAVGVNVNFPVFNGHLFSARRAEAELRAQALGQKRRDLEDRISRDVSVAWLNAGTAFQRVGLTAQLLDQATQALDLAQSRYDLGLSSIVELSQAQLNKTSAEIQNATARYEYQMQRAVLSYQVGALR